MKIRAFEHAYNESLVGRVLLNGLYVYGAKWNVNHRPTYEESITILGEKYGIYKFLSAHAVSKNHDEWLSSHGGGA